MLMVLLFVGDNNMDVMYFPFFVVKNSPITCFDWYIGQGRPDYTIAINPKI